MILDKDGAAVLPAGWEMWTTGKKWQGQTTWANEDKPETYTGICRSRGDAIRVARKIIRRKKSEDGKL